MMLTISSLKVQGFRGYTNYQELVFDNDAVFLFGDNHKGKSSTLNAIEWCLFGDESVGGTTGLRERIGWEVPNRNMDPSKETFVELTLKDEQGSEYKVLRKYITAKKDALTVTFPDNKSFTDADATSKLSSL
ncbi:MAG TPA: AAA family ATPase, partial [Candidatus Syntrophosphaera thermopropionivorans]|nr:AAA family ATPase [Candidatus Syntrophosphaera thermopropionivorans]